jgi:K+-sensing histidine kinase KdpD
MALCIGIVAAVGYGDYFTGYETFCFIFYLIAVFLAVWHVGDFSGGLISALSVAAWISSNIAAGERYSSYFVPVWNAVIRFVFYLVVVVLLAKLRTLHQELEEQVRQRTARLTKEIREQTQLQKELLETSERVQWALEKGQISEAQPALGTGLTPYIKLNSAGVIPACPAGGTYTVAAIGTVPSVTCSLSATVTPPHVMP